MINQKLVEVLQCLDDEQLQKLLLFLQSPYFNNAYNAEQIVDLYEFLSAPEQLPRLELIEKETLHEQYFPQHSYQPKQKNPIDALTSDLFRLVKEFIHLEMAKEDNYASKNHLYLAKFYLQKNLPDRFQQVINQFSKYQKARKDVGPWYYLDNFLVELEVALFRSIYNTYTDDINLVSTHKSLDQYYRVSKLSLTAALKHQKSLGLIDDTGVLEETGRLIAAFDDVSAKMEPLNVFYLIILDWLDNPPSLEAVRKYEADVLAIRDQIEDHTLRNLMAFQRNFYFQAYRKAPKSPALETELIDIHKRHLKEGFFEVYGKILPVSLNAIIAVALRTGDIAFAKQVLVDYPPEKITGTNYAEEAHSLCEAEVLFKNQEYDLALEKLVYRNFENINYSILVDTLMVRVYYITDNELIYNRIRALEQKIRRSKVSATRQASFLNFLKILNQILKYKHDKTSDKWLKIRVKLEKMEIVAYRAWLQQIINE
jgi:hypothetical protein